MPRSILLIGFVCLVFGWSAQGQRIVNGNFDNTFNLHPGSQYRPLDQNLSIAAWQLGYFNQITFRLLNFPIQRGQSITDSIHDFSQGLFLHALVDSTDTFSFKKTQIYPNGTFLDWLLGPWEPARTQFFNTPFTNKQTLSFMHHRTQYGPYTPPVLYKLGNSSLKASIDYSTALTVNTPYLISCYTKALDTILGMWNAPNVLYHSEIVDSIFIGSALNDSSVGDTLAIVHPKLHTWSKHFILFTPTKPYTHFTIGNCSAEWGYYGGNAIDECSIFAIQQTSNKTFLICAGDSVQIGDTTSFKTEWNTGDTLPIKWVTQQKWYTRYTYPTDSTVSIDSFEVRYTNSVSTVTDTTVCENTALVLSSSRTHPTSTYTWSSGQNQSSITTQQTGWIQCKTVTQNGCTVTDSFLVNREPAITINLTTDTVLCYGQTKLLASTPQPGVHYVWSTFDTVPFISVSKPGLYQLIGSNEYCKDSAARQVIAKGIVNVSLPADTVFCFEDLKTLLLDAGDEYVNYLWKPTGETTSSIYATTAQRYTVWVKDSTLCDGSATTLVNETCPDFVFVPNAFTPNGDGINDVFLPRTRSLQSYEMTIVNRWGQIVFTTKDAIQGWDGSNAPADVYVVQITYQPKGKSSQSIVQNVTLLR